METAIIIFIIACLAGAGSIFIPEWNKMKRKKYEPLKVYVVDSHPIPTPVHEPYDEIIDVAPEDIKLISQTQRRIGYDS